MKYWKLEIRNLKFRQGYAALTAILLIISSSLAIIGGLAFFALQEAGANRAYARSVAARAAAEAGIEDAIWRVVSGKPMGGAETLAVGSDTTTVSLAVAGNQRTIRSDGRSGNIAQNMETLLDISTTDIGFHFGVQVGAGGLAMGQNASVSGGVFSDGPIAGENGAVITGDAFAAGASGIADVAVSGNARAHLIESSTISGSASCTTLLDDVIVGKDAHANELREATVNKNAYYNVIDKKSVVLGSRVTPTTAPTDLAPISMPIADATMDQWKQDAVKGGSIEGDYSVISDVPLGPKEIKGNLLLDANNKTLTVTGTLYVHGYIDISNGSTIKCDAGYAATSCIVIADRQIHVQNNSAFSGSGQAGSFVMLISTLACDGSSTVPPCDAPHHHGAIDLHNNSTGAIFYAARGLLNMHNGVGISEATAYKMSLSNNAAVTYESGLADAKFSSGPSGGYQVQYWRRVP